MLVPTTILSLSLSLFLRIVSSSSQRHCYGFTHRALRGRSAKRNLIHGGLRNETSSSHILFHPSIARQTAVFLWSQGKSVRLRGFSSNLSSSTKVSHRFESVSRMWLVTVFGLRYVWNSYIGKIWKCGKENWISV